MKLKESREHSTVRARAVLRALDILVEELELVKRLLTKATSIYFNRIKIMICVVVRIKVRIEQSIVVT